MTSISEYTLDDIQIGQVEQFSVKIGESMLNDFAKISGDHNPLHMDQIYAETTRFKNRVCHGMLLASFFSRLIGMHIPGKNSLYFSQTLNFRSPCFVGDEVKIRGEVKEKHLVTRMITLKTTIHNQIGECLVDGVAKVIVRE